MARMTGGQALVKSLIRHGIDTVFGIPGVQLDHLFTAFHDERNAIRVINTRHEQGAAYMALGYALATGRIGAFAVVPGPGLLNTTAALSTAYACNAPVLCITGQIPQARIGRGLGLLHEVPDQLGILERLTKWAARITEPQAAPAIIDEAVRRMLSGRIRPTGVEIPLDVLPAEAEINIGEAGPPSLPPVPDRDAIEAAARALGAARAPVIVVGGGVYGASAPLLALADRLQAPVVASQNGLGALDSRHPLAFTYPGGYRLMAACDVVLAVGTRIQRPLMNWRMAEGRTLIRIDIDAEEIDRVSTPQVAVHADAAEALGAINARIGEFDTERPSRADDIARVRAEMEAEFARLEPQISYLRAIRDALPEDGYFVEELTQVGYVARIAFPVYRPRSFISTGYQGTLGFGFATALGVKVARPASPVVAIAGDGGFMYNVQELATAVHHRIPVTCVVFRDDAFGNVKRMQQDDYGGRVIASDFTNPDFPALATSFGAQGLRATNADELGAAVKKGLAASVPTIIEVPIGPVPDPWHLIHLPPLPPGDG